MTDSGKRYDEKTAANLINPKTDEDFFALGRVLLKNSTCLKTQTAAVIVSKSGEVVSYGANMCCPQNQLYGLPVGECPRMKIHTGGMYELCKPIHAEIVACTNAIGISHIERRHLWHFPGFTLRLKRFEGFLSGATMYLLGHYWACGECKEFVKLFGISEIKFDEISGGTTLKKYRKESLTAEETGALDVSGCILGGVVTVRVTPDRVAEFCERQGIERANVIPFPGRGAAGGDEAGTFFVSVPTGKERNRADVFRHDPAVQSAELLFSK